MNESNRWDNFETKELTLINKSMSYGIVHSDDKLDKEQITEAIAISNEIANVILDRQKNGSLIGSTLQTTVIEAIIELLLKEIDQSRP